MAPRGTSAGLKTSKKWIVRGNLSVSVSSFAIKSLNTLAAKLERFPCKLCPNTEGYPVCQTEDKINLPSVRWCWAYRTVLRCHALKTAFGISCKVWAWGKWCIGRIEGIHLEFGRFGVTSLWSQQHTVLCALLCPSLPQSVLLFQVAQLESSFLSCWL